jgi:hypothetical protein
MSRGGGVGGGFSSPSFKGHGLEAEGRANGAGGGKLHLSVPSSPVELGCGRGLGEFEQAPQSPTSEVKSFSERAPRASLKPNVGRK